MRILIPIGLLFTFVLFVIIVVIQSLLEVSGKTENESQKNASQVGEEIKACLETAKTLPLPILNCQNGECQDLRGIFQCQKMLFDNKHGISEKSEEILCRNITKVLSCDKSIIKQPNNQRDNNYTNKKNLEQNKTNIYFTTRGIYYCAENTICGRVAEPSVLCQCEISSSVNEIENV